ncbi:MAG: transporter [Candidatus Acidiferrales bacterium]
MTFRPKLILVILSLLVLGLASPSRAQQKGQWVPGQFGLNAGVIPDPGLTYGNLALNYSAGQLNDPNGNKLPGVTGTYSFWVDENIFYYVPKHKFLGGYFMPYVVLNWASGELVADITLGDTNLNGAGGGSGFADMFVEPLQMGWHFGKRVDFVAGYAFVAPTGRFTAGASNNVGSGYWGNNIDSGTTLYITKNHATTANLTTDWEIHGTKRGTNITPGQAFTMEWGIGQVLPIKKDMSILGQIGLVGYDQWQVSNNSGTTLVGGIPVPQSALPYYSVHAIGVQANLILPPKNATAFFKYYNEYSALARPEGRTIAFGFTWTLRIPKPTTPPPPAAAPAPAKP